MSDDATSAQHEHEHQHDHEDSLEEEELTTGQDVSALGVAAGGGEATLEAYDLDDDGKVSIIEGARAQLGVVDARLDELGERPGIVGKLAEAAHHLVDRLDNDDPRDPDDTSPNDDTSPGAVDETSGGTGSGAAAPEG